MALSDADKEVLTGILITLAGQRMKIAERQKTVTKESIELREADRELWHACELIERLLKHDP
jgi:hypothetical protein